MRITPIGTGGADRGRSLLSARVDDEPGRLGTPISSLMEYPVSDVWFILLTIAVFVVLGLIAKGVEKL